VFARAFALAERAEALGLDAVWVDGNHFTDVWHGPSPLLVAAALAARTRRIAIGVATVTLTLAEHPLHVAEEALFVDALAAGRLVLGVGLGYRADELEGFGVPRAERRARFDDALRILREAFTDAPEFPAPGRHFAVGAAVVPQPRPVREGGPPIWVGGGWRAGAVRNVARLGLPLISQFFEPVSVVAEKVRIYREHAAPGAPGLRTVPVIRDVAVGPPVELARALVPVYRRYAEWGMPLLGRPTHPDEIGPAEVSTLAWLGEEDALARRMDELDSAGGTDLLARADLPGLPRAAVERTLEALAALHAAACADATPA
jgi:alkanesulfonate monooxygenase SsuD/methylene tetrahydromethanopterin reductase-like flavin-dependent oxidoreductase (luciferase family)